MNRKEKLEGWGEVKKILPRIMFLVFVILLVQIGVYLSVGIFEMEPITEDTMIDMDRYVTNKYIRYDNYYFMVSAEDNVTMQEVKVTEGAYRSYDVGDWYDIVETPGKKIIPHDVWVRDILTPYIIGTVAMLILFKSMYFIIGRMIENDRTA